MDYNDKLAGLDNEYFTNKAQLFLIECLLKKAKNKSLAKKNIKILSVGCGDGNELKVLRRYGNVDILDINRKVLDLIPRKLYSRAFIKDVCTFSTVKKYDLIVAFDILEHVEKDQQAIKNIYKLLNPGGYLMFTVPAHQKLFSAHDKALEHYRRYNKNDLQKKLEVSGFRKIFLSYRYFFLFLPVMISKLRNKHTKPKIEAPKIPRIINKILLYVLRFEIFLMKLSIRLPLGISLVGVYRKDSVKNAKAQK